MSGFALPMLVFEILLSLGGLVLLWRHVASPAARLNARPSPLPAWKPEITELLILIAFVTLGMFIASFGANLLIRANGLRGDIAIVAGGAAAQIGMLLGVIFYAARCPGYRRQAEIGLGRILRSGVVTFLIAMPILHATGQAWDLLLRLFGVPAERQDLIRMFLEAESGWQITSLVLLAVAIAPVAEELIFRAGLFRFLLTLAPRFLALLLPGVFFAALHVNWVTLEGFASFLPLLVLSLLFSLAYERTGHIGTVIVAHALFNLNTIAMIFCGVGT
ncbi:CPBP family intramembrane glutamic endopeptidase [Opitutus sp. ER46]|uniref:CPBP family intramembrane glutamic endopeptidase n=1 Tax=Opitutus sp. ER46 TaxID=2161864 RepID=UPI000D316B8F|nr:CPBP family intramembrane glutamic endopeptidase [Opitutus sp. ER46]PTY00349.1 hypothetical protein DB354_01695 [Opitutus sp. ER46]